MMECKRCGAEAPTVIAYGTEVFVCCGFPLVGTDRTLRLRDHIEHGRRSEEARVRQYQERIAALEEELAEAHRRLDVSPYLFKRYVRREDREARMRRTIEALRANDARPYVARLVWLLADLAEKHTEAENEAAAVLGTSRCPLPGPTALIYQAVADALRYGMNVTAEELQDALDNILPPARTSVDPGGAGCAPRGEAVDQAPEPELEGDGADPRQPSASDREAFWHDYTE